mmetsp:Transcript_3252/g.7204  ORF Transcript_3252/g.7204 Transcript_3252/m.7204 type:complete len:217 (+) Transcript_3252:353-1003(+)
MIKVICAACSQINRRWSTLFWGSSGGHKVCILSPLFRTVPDAKRLGPSEPLHVEITHIARLERFPMNQITLLTILKRYSLSNHLTILKQFRSHIRHINITTIQSHRFITHTINHSLQRQHGRFPNHIVIFYQHSNRNLSCLHLLQILLCLIVFALFTQKTIIINMSIIQSLHLTCWFQIQKQRMIKFLQSPHQLLACISKQFFDSPFVFISHLHQM